jgi:hypothetical protein
MGATLQRSEVPAQMRESSACHITSSSSEYQCNTSTCALTVPAVPSRYLTVLPSSCSPEAMGTRLLLHVADRENSRVQAFSTDPGYAFHSQLHAHRAVALASAGKGGGLQFEYKPCAGLYESYRV